MVAPNAPSTAEAEQDIGTTVAVAPAGGWTELEEYWGGNRGRLDEDWKVEDML